VQLLVPEGSIADIDEPVTDISIGYVGPARIAAKGSRGFLTFQDSRGLNVVDLTHL